MSPCVTSLILQFTQRAWHWEQKWHEKMDGGERKQQALNIGNLPRCGKHAAFKSKSQKPWSLWMPFSRPRQPEMKILRKVYMEVRGAGPRSQVSHHEPIPPLLGLARVSRKGASDWHGSKMMCALIKPGLIGRLLEEFLSLTIGCSAILWPGGQFGLKFGENKTEFSSETFTVTKNG